MKDVEFSIINKMKEKNGNNMLRASLEDYKIIDANRGIVKMVFSFSRPINNKQEALEIMKKESKSFNIISSSLILTKNLVHCIAKLSKEPEIKNIGEDKKLKLIKANVMVSDEDNSIWHIEDIAGKQFLIKDRSAELQSALAFRKKVVNASVIEDINVKVGDICIVCDTQSDGLTAGIVLSENGDKIELWTKDKIKIKSYKGLVMAVNEQKSLLETEDISKIKDYFDNLYKNSKFKNRLDEIFDYMS